MNLITVQFPIVQFQYNGAWLRFLCNFEFDYITLHTAQFLFPSGYIMPFELESTFKLIMILIALKQSLVPVWIPLRPNMSGQKTARVGIILSSPTCMEYFTMLLPGGLTWNCISSVPALSYGERSITTLWETNPEGIGYINNALWSVVHLVVGALLQVVHAVSLLVILRFARLKNQKCVKSKESQYISAPDCSLVKVSRSALAVKAA